ncbi:MAG: hypothetical protein JO166_19290 [Deltaproteobacteria bacterium]|nr:hypothetical protein [Deltaproteobacteria bacterium]
MRKLKLYVPSEMSEQQTVCEWARFTGVEISRTQALAQYAQWRTAPDRTPVKAKRAGSKPGCPDLYLDVRAAASSG